MSIYSKRWDRDVSGQTKWQFFLLFCRRVLGYLRPDKVILKSDCDVSDQIKRRLLQKWNWDVSEQTLILNVCPGRVGPDKVKWFKIWTWTLRVKQSKAWFCSWYRDVSGEEKSETWFCRRDRDVSQDDNFCLWCRVNAFNAIFATILYRTSNVMLLSAAVC